MVKNLYAKCLRNADWIVEKSDNQDPAAVEYRETVKEEIVTSVLAAQINCIKEVI